MIAQSGPLIILVDDNRIELLLNSRLLNHTKISDNIITFDNGSDLLDYINNATFKKDENPAIVLLDIQMPELNGFEVLERFDKFPEDKKAFFKIYILSSTLSQVDREKTENDPNVVEFLPKPLDTDQFRLSLLNRSLM